MKIKKTSNLIIYVFFLIYLTLGLFTLKDYGINIEEHTQLYSGIYWLNYIYDFFEINKSNELINLLNQISRDTQLPNPAKYTYGPVYDVPIAFLEVWLNTQDRSLSFEVRHFFIFIIFFISTYFFFKILDKRFKNFFVSFFGLLLFIFSPRIYGDSFHNNKDIIFLSLVVISIYFAFKIFEKKKIKNILLFSLFSALATSTRIMGLFLPVSIILFIFLSDQNKNIKKIRYYILIVIFYFLFLILHWPFLWEAPIENFLQYIKNSQEWIFSYYILYNGKYILTTNLPDSYIFTWIGVTTPIINVILLLLGFCFVVNRLFLRFILIDKVQSNYSDFWRSKNEMKDYFIFFNLTTILSTLLFLNVSLVSGWRHLYFLNIFIVYLAAYSLNIILLRLKSYKIKILILLTLIPNFMKIIEFHPYQSLYFNELLSDKRKNSFLIDREGISRLDSINIILDIDNKNEINVANASFVPYYRISDVLNESDKKRINFVGTDYDKADYIYNNYVYEINPEYDDKYKIPKNFEMIYKLEIDGIIIYEIYKRI